MEHNNTLPTIGDQLDLGYRDEDGTNRTGTVVALMGLPLRGKWTALSVVDQGDDWENGRYRSGWIYGGVQAFLPDMHSHDTQAEAMEYMVAWWQQVAALPQP